MDHFNERLKEIETRMPEHVAQRDALCEKISKLRSTDDWVRHQLTTEASALTEQIEGLTVEACGLRIQLSEAELPAARAVLPGLEQKFDQAMARYFQSRIDADAIGFQLMEARSVVFGLEGAIRDDQNRIQDVRDAQARRADRRVA